MEYPEHKAVEVGWVEPRPWGWLKQSKPRKPESHTFIEQFRKHTP